MDSSEYLPADHSFELEGCSIWDYPKADKVDLPDEESDSDDSFYRLKSPKLEDKFDPNYVKHLNEVISSTYLDKFYPPTPRKKFNISHNSEVFLDLEGKGKLRETDEQYEIFPKICLDNSFDSEEEPEREDENWFEGPQFKSFYDKFTQNMNRSPVVKKKQEDPVEETNCTSKKLENKQPLFGEPYRKVDPKFDRLKSKFQAEMECAAAYDVNFSDEESASANLNISDIIEEDLQTEPTITEKDLECFYCAFTTSRQLDLNHHISDKHINRKFSCFRCNFLTSDRNILKKHVTKIHLQKCNLCDFESLIKEELKEHKLKVHWIKDFWECTMCTYMTSDESKLVNHVAVAHPLADDNLQYNLLQCYSCSFSSSSTKDLKLHLITAHLEPKTVQCKICEYQPITWRDHEEHNEKHHLLLTTKLVATQPE